MPSSAMVGRQNSGWRSPPAAHGPSFRRPRRENPPSTTQIKLDFWKKAGECLTNRYECKAPPRHRLSAHPTSVACVFLWNGPTPLREPAVATPVIENSTFERHYRIGDLARIWGLGRETVRKLVKDDPGVVKVRMGRKKAHTIYSVPVSAAQRIHTRLLNATPVRSPELSPPSALAHHQTPP
jgi:hypothetical protein